MAVFLLAPLALGMALLPYVLHRFLLITLARHEAEVNPNFLFISSVTMLPVIAGFLILIYYLIGDAAVHFHDAEFAVLGLSALLALVWYANYQFAVRAGRRDQFALLRRVVTPFQMWMQDLIVGALMLGVVLTVVMTLAAGARLPELLFWIALEMLSLAPAFVIALRVLRYCHVRSGLQRATWLTWILIAASIPGVTWLFLLPAWHTFLTALSRAPEKNALKQATGTRH